MKYDKLIIGDNMKKILLTIIIFLFLVPFMIRAEELKIELQKNWGGKYGDGFNNIFQTEDGCFIAIGYTWSKDIEGLANKGEEDAIIVKYDKDFNIIWQKSWGSTGVELFNSAFQTEDGGFIASGYTMSTDIEGLSNKGEKDAIIVKYDQEGNLQWQSSWGGNADDSFNEVFQIEDGTFIATGYSYSTDIEGLSNKGGQDVIIVKYDQEGNMIWQKSWGGNAEDNFNEIFQTKDCTFIASGETWSTDIEGLPNKGYRDAIIIKYDKDFNIILQKIWRGNAKEQFYEVFQTKDEGLIVVGSSDWQIDGAKGSFDGIIVKYDKDFNIIWNKNWGSTNADYFYDISQTEDGNFIVFGNTWSTDIEGLSNKGESDAIIVKYDKDFNVIWQNSWGGNLKDDFYEVIQTEDGKFIVVGRTKSTNIEGLTNKGESDAIIVKYSIDYKLENIETENSNGTFEVVQQGYKGIITPQPNEGYEVDQIIVKDKDGNILDVEIIKLEGGTYSFQLYTDVSVEVTYKLKVDNPKTGILDYGTIILLFMIIPILGVVYICRYNTKYGL